MRDIGGRVSKSNVRVRRTTRTTNTSLCSARVGYTLLYIAHFLPHYLQYDDLLTEWLDEHERNDSACLPLSRASVNPFYPYLISFTGQFPSRQSLIRLHLFSSFRLLILLFQFSSSESSSSTLVSIGPLCVSGTHYSLSLTSDSLTPLYALWSNIRQSTSAGTRPEGRRSFSYPGTGAG